MVVRIIVSTGHEVTTHLAKWTKENENFPMIVSSNMLHFGLSEVEFARLAIFAWNFFNMFNFCLELELSLSLKFPQVVECILSLL